MHSAYRSKYFEDDIIKMPEFLVDSISVVFVGKVFQQIVISNGNKLDPSSSRHISLHSLYSEYGKEAVGISVQFHIQVHR